MRKHIVAALAATLLYAAQLAAAFGQGSSGPQQAAALGYCQLSASALASSVALSKCVRASFTSTAGTPSTQLVVTSVTGIILVGDQIVSGTGLTVGTVVTGQISGTPGGAGTYQLSAANTASSAATTSGGIPPGATSIMMQSEVANVRYRDDGAAATASIGIILPSGGSPVPYAGPLKNLQFIAVTGSPLVDLAFYR